MRHYSEEPILPSETARSRRPEGYYHSLPHHHVDQSPRYSPGPRRRGSGTRSHHSSRPSTSHGNRSPDSHRHRIGVTHSHSHRHTSHDNRERSSRSNRSCVRRSISQDSSRRRISQHCKVPESSSQKGVILEESKSTQRSNNEEGRDTNRLPCEAEVIQLESEPEILDEVEGTESTMDPNPEKGTIETPEVVEQEPEPQQEVQNGNSEMETEEAEELFPSKKRRKKFQEQRRSKKEKGSQSVDTSQLEQHEDGEQNQSTSVLFSPSDRHLAFMTTVQKTHEVSKLSDEIEKLNEHQAKLTYYIRQLKFIRSQNKEEKRQLRRRRSVLLAGELYICLLIKIRKEINIIIIKHNGCWDLSLRNKLVLLLGKGSEIRRWRDCVRCSLFRSPRLGGKLGGDDHSRTN